MTERPAFRMLPALTPESRPSWTGGPPAELLIYRCHACTRFFQPPAPARFRCRSRAVGPVAESGRATVAGHTITHHQWFDGFPSAKDLRVAAVGAGGGPVAGAMLLTRGR